MISRVALCLVGTLFLIFLQQCTAQGHFENVALNKACTQSTVYNPSSGPPDLACTRAVNSDTNGYYSTTGNCIHTDGDDYSQSWQVNLQQPFPIHHIVVWARDLFLKRMTNCEIYVDAKLCYRFETQPRERNVTINCNTSLSGQVVRLNKTSNLGNGDNAINLCEFEVYVCSDGYWGSDCDTACGRCSSGQSCDKHTGDCPAGCAVGFYPPKCTERIVDGQWGSWTGYDACSQSCGGGSQTRRRSCDDPAPVNGGDDCPGASEDTRKCNAADCPPVDGEWGLWGVWGTCSETCGGGSQSRSRQCDHPAPANGGANCPGNDTDAQDCNALPCQVGGLDPQTAVPVAAIAGAAVGGVVVTAAIAAVIFFVFVRRRGRNTHDASGTDGHAHRKTGSATSPEGGTTTDDNYEDVSGVGTVRPSDRQDGSCTNPDSSSTATSSATATTPGATVYQNVGDDAAINYERLEVSTVGQISVYTKLKKPKK